MPLYDLPGCRFPCRIAGHDAADYLRQFAYVYSQSLPSGFELECSCFSAVELGDLKQGILFNASNSKFTNLFAGLGYYANSLAFAPCKDEACGNIAMNAVSLVRLGACRIAVQAV